MVEIPPTGFSERQQDVRSLSRPNQYILDVLESWRASNRQSLGMLKQKTLIFTLCCCSTDSSTQGMAYPWRQAATERPNKGKFLKPVQLNHENTRPKIRFVTPEVKLTVDGENPQWVYAEIERIGAGKDIEMNIQSMMMQIAMSKSQRTSCALLMVSAKDLLEHQNGDAMAAGVKLVERYFTDQCIRVAIDYEDKDQWSVINALSKLGEMAATHPIIKKLLKYMHIRLNSRGFVAADFVNQMRIAFGGPLQVPTQARGGTLTQFLSQLTSSFKESIPDYRRLIAACNMNKMKIYLRTSSPSSHEREMAHFLNILCLTDKMSITMLREIHEAERKEILDKHREANMQVITIERAEFERGNGVVEKDLRLLSAFIDVMPRKSEDVNEEVLQNDKEHGIYRAKYVTSKITESTEVVLKFIFSQADVSALDRKIKLLKFQEKVIDTMQTDFPALYQHKRRLARIQENLVEHHQQFTVEIERQFFELLPSVSQRNYMMQVVNLLGYCGQRVVDITKVVTQLRKHQVLCTDFTRSCELYSCSYDAHLVETPMKLSCGKYVDKLCHLRRVQRGDSLRCIWCNMTHQGYPQEVSGPTLEKYQQLLANSLTF